MFFKLENNGDLSCHACNIAIHRHDLSILICAVVQTIYQHCSYIICKKIVAAKLAQFLRNSVIVKSKYETLSGPCKQFSFLLGRDLSVLTWSWSKTFSLFTLYRHKSPQVYSISVVLYAKHRYLSLSITHTRTIFQAVSKRRQEMQLTWLEGHLLLYHSNLT